MKRAVQVSLCALMILCLNVFAQAQKARKSHPPEQRSFDAEVKMKHMVSLPGEVLRILQDDEDVRRRCLGQYGPGRVEAALFAASPIHLGDRKSPDLFVTSAEDNPCLGGANIDPFWVFYWTPQGYRLGLRVDTHDLEVMRTETKGYSDIRTVEATGTELVTTVFKFDGSQYKVWRSRKAPIKV